MILDWWYSCWAYLFGLKPHYFIFGVILMGLQLFNLGLLLALFWAYFDLGLLWFVHESILLQLDSFLLSSRCPTCGGLDFLIESKLETYIRAQNPKALAKGFGRLVRVGRQLIFGRRILVGSLFFIIWSRRELNYEILFHPLCIGYTFFLLLIFVSCHLFVLFSCSISCHFF